MTEPVQALEEGRLVAIQQALVEPGLLVSRPARIASGFVGKGVRSACRAPRARAVAPRTRRRWAPLAAVVLTAAPPGGPEEAAH